MPTFTPSPTDVFTATADQIASGQTSHLNGDGTLTMTKDENSADGFPAVNSVTIDTEATGQHVSVDFGGTTENVIATVYTASASTSFGQVNVTLDLLGTDDTGLALVADPSIPEGIVLSNIVQNFGTGLSETFTPAFTLACFAAGTHIATAAGEVVVEALREGEPVVTAFGECVPVRWIGHRHIDITRQPRPQDLWPVRVHAAAFGPDLPHRDLLLSPDHAVFVDGVLVPIRYLINGATIVQEPADSVTYWHVELPEHDVLLAEGLPVESYLDTGNRAAFVNGGDVVAAHPDFSRRVWQEKGRAPLLVEGPVLAAQQARLLERAATLGHARTDDPDLCVSIGGTTLRPRRDGAALVWDLPAGTSEVTLRSLSDVPAWTAPGQADHRRLGVAVQRILLDGRELKPAARVGGWHAPEAGFQWTDGEATLAAGPGRLEVTLAMCASYWRDAEPGGARHVA
jgi:hypothetical protein